MKCATVTRWIRRDSIGPRCIEKAGRGKKCGRPALTYTLSKHGIELSQIDLCQKHCDDLRQRGYSLAATDKAKGAAA